MNPLCSILSRVFPCYGDPQTVSAGQDGARSLSCCDTASAASRVPFTCCYRSRPVKAATSIVLPKIFQSSIRPRSYRACSSLVCRLFADFVFATTSRRAWKDSETHPKDAQSCPDDVSCCSMLFPSRRRRNCPRFTPVAVVKRTLRVGSGRT